MESEVIKLIAQYGPLWVILVVALFWVGKFFTDKWWPHYQERTKLLDTATLERAKADAEERRAREAADREERQKLLEVIENNTESVQHNSAVTARLEQMIAIMNTEMRALQEQVRTIDARTSEGKG